MKFYLEINLYHRKNLQPVSVSVSWRIQHSVIGFNTGIEGSFIKKPSFKISQDFDHIAHDFYLAKLVIHELKNNTFRHIYFDL